MENFSFGTKNSSLNIHNISFQSSYIINENTDPINKISNQLVQNKQHPLKNFTKKENKNQNNNCKLPINSRFFGKNLINSTQNDLNNKAKDNIRHSWECPSTTNSNSPTMLYSPSIVLEKCQLEKLNDPQYVIEYSKEILTNLMLTENINKPSYDISSIISNDSQITENSRRILINWIISVHYRFELLPETLYLTINIIDRVISQKKILLSDFQLLGVTSMLIASKYEEIYAPEIRDFIYITGKSITKNQILQMENQILSLLKFELLVVSPYTFLNQFYFLYDCKDIEVYYLSLMFIEISFFDVNFLKHNNSLIAACLFYLALKIKNGKSVSWSSLLKLHSGYDEKEVSSCVKEFGVFYHDFIKNSKLDSIVKKYENEKYGNIVKKVFKNKNHKNKIDH